MGYTISGDPQYRALAASAAAALGASSPQITRAILAQWQCEHGNGDKYPPSRNNPGNIARGAARSLSVPFSVAPGPNPQPGNPIVTYSSPEAGAAAYAELLRKLPRYAGVVRAARAGDGAAFIRAMGSSGWGTGTGCMMSVYGSSSGGTAPPPSKPPTGAGTGGTGAGTSTGFGLPGVDLPGAIGGVLAPIVGRGILLLGIVGGILLGVWLLFREPATKIAGAVVSARTGGIIT